MGGVGLGWAVGFVLGWAVGLGGWVGRWFVLFVLECCVVRARNDIARRRPTTTKKGAERWALILVFPRHFGRVVKASAC